MYIQANTMEFINEKQKQTIELIEIIFWKYQRNVYGNKYYHVHVCKLLSVGKLWNNANNVADFKICLKFSIDKCNVFETCICGAL